jgi:outer membrane protein, heavy metal efflux system
MNIQLRRVLTRPLCPLIAGMLVAGIAHATESASAASPVAAVPLTLAEATRLAVTRQPLLEGLAAQSRATRETAILAQQLPDPKLFGGVVGLPINGGDAYSLQRDGDTQLQIGVMQEFPRAEKRRLRGELAEREAERIEAEQSLTQRAIKRDAALAWLELWRYTQSLKLARASLREAETQAAAVEIALKTGSASQSELLTARVEVSRLQDEIAGKEQGIGHARNQLSRWIGVAAMRPVADSVPDAPFELTTNAALERVRSHPHLGELHAQIAASQTGIELAKADYAPDWRVELGYGYRPAYSEMLMLQVGIDLPFFTKNRQDRALASALAKEDVATAALEDGLRLHEAETRMNLEDRSRLKQRLKHYDEQLLPQAAQRVEAALLGWRAGRGTLAQVLEARRAVLDLALSRLDLQHDYAQHFVQLTYLGAYETLAAGPENSHE